MVHLPDHELVADEHVVEEHLVGPLVADRPGRVDREPGVVHLDQEQRDHGW